ncbi:MAG: AfsR/SARP family transcriptional regulator, partial [Actinomycetota bacterium]
MFHAPIRPGPTPRYCRPSHRQRAYEARRKAAQTDGVSSAPFEARSPSGGGPFIRVLGPIEAFDLHGCPVSLGPSLRRVLAILAVRPREVVSREAFIDRVWPDVDDRVASRRLHTAVWKLRLLLAGGDEAEARRLIRWSAPGYLLDVSDDHLDWARFRRLRQAGERALREGAHSLARGYLSAALSLWNGPEVLAGVDVSADDLGFVAERLAGRERAARNLIQARFELGDQVIPD